MAKARKDLRDKRPEEQPTDIAGMVKRIEELMADVPEEDWADIPTDLARNHEHYLYGYPKQYP